MQGNSRPTDHVQDRLIEALDGPAAFGHPIKYRQLIETHISWVILTGEYAYKIKKPVNFGFVDFSTLEKRRHYCVEELRLNRRFAPEIYLGLVEIRGTAEAPVVGGEGEILEYAVRMHEFPQSCLLSAHAQSGDLDNDTIDSIATLLAAAHEEAPRADSDSDYGSAAMTAHWSDENLRQIESAVGTGLLPGSYFELTRWYLENRNLLDVVEARRRAGKVRECHGDLHLGNMALIEGAVRFFDCIEFNPELRWIDTLNEAAFVAMDLEARGYPGFCWRFLDHYLAQCGDYAGIVLLRYYFIYRALVRAKVAALKIHQEDAGADRARLAGALDYLELAASWARTGKAGLIVMHGLSGSGKSTVAARLVEELGAIRIRSDVERKRLHGLQADADSGSSTAGGIYDEAATEKTYRHLAGVARTIVDAGFTVIVDAATLRARERQWLLEIEPSRPCKRIVVSCDAPVDELRRRISERQGDVSEANLAVLEHQIETREPITRGEQELAQLVTLDAAGLDDSATDLIRTALRK